MGPESSKNPREGQNVIRIADYRARLANIGRTEAPIKFGVTYEFKFTPQSVATYCLLLMKSGKITDEQAGKVIDILETFGPNHAMQQLVYFLEQDCCLGLVPALK